MKQIPYTIIFLLCLATVSSFAEDIPLWPDGAPGAQGTEKQDIPTLKIFPGPKDIDGPVPAVLLIPGGGYKHISGYGNYWDFFKDRPVRFFSMKYRLPVHGYRHPAPLQDAKRAVATIRSRAEEWNIDPDRVVVVAFSSGGHVATTLATHFDLPAKDADTLETHFGTRPDYLALFCPVVSMTSHPHQASVNRLLGPDPTPELLNDLSNELQVTDQTPPTLLVHAKDDGLVPPQNSQAFHRALKKAKVETTLHLYPEGGHGVVNDKNPWKLDFEVWLNQHGLLSGPTREAAEKPAFEPLSHYTTKELEGWTLHVHNDLLPGGALQETGRVALEKFKDHMIQVKSWMPDKPLAELLKVPIWLEVDSTRGPHGNTAVYQYHPGLDWLVKMAFHPEKVKCIEYGRAISLAKSGPGKSETLLHELAHAYHDRVLSFDHPEILAAYKRCVEGDTYPERDWVKSDHKEFFAGVTTRYFGPKEQRDAVGARDPVLAKLLREIWGEPKAYREGTR